MRLQRAARWRDAVQKAHTAIQQRIAGLKTEITTMEGKIEGRAKLEKQGQEFRGEQDIYDQIHNALRADRFIDHLLGRAYDDLCRRGSEHLMRLSCERYSFAAAKNTFNVKDGWNGDAERPAGTLSGGESFFASLWSSTISARARCPTRISRSVWSSGRPDATSSAVRARVAGRIDRGASGEKTF